MSNEVQKALERAREIALEETVESEDVDAYELGYQAAARRIAARIAKLVAREQEVGQMSYAGPIDPRPSEETEQSVKSGAPAP